MDPRSASRLDDVPAAAAAQRRRRSPAGEHHPSLQRERWRGERRHAGLSRDDHAHLPPRCAAVPRRSRWKGAAARADQRATPLAHGPPGLAAALLLATAALFGRGTTAFRAARPRRLATALLARAHARR